MPWRRRRGVEVVPTDPAVLGDMIRGPGRTLDDVEAWCARLRQEGVAGSALVFAWIDPGGKMTDGPLRELGVWPRSTSGGALRAGWG